MTKHITTVAILAVLLLVAVPALAKPNVDRQPTIVVPSEREVVIPAHAIEVAPGVFNLGTAVDPESGKVVEGFAFVHPRKEYHHRPDHAGGPGGPGGGGGEKCYAFLAKDTKWKNVEGWTVNTSNSDGLSEAFVFDTLSDAITEWEDAASGVDILGSGFLATTTLSADEVSPDGLNEVYFGSLDPGTIGVTIVWGIFGGRPAGRELSEWDQVYNTFYPWSDDGAVGTMDFENIAQHELGHSIGMGHPGDTCTEETMYRFADFEETNKRDLNAGDIVGVDKLY